MPTMEIPTAGPIMSLAFTATIDIPGLKTTLAAYDRLSVNIFRVVYILTRFRPIDTRLSCT